MYIVSVLVEHPVQSLDMTFDYLSHESLLKGSSCLCTFWLSKDYWLC